MVGKSAGYNKEKLGVVDVATEYFSRKQRCVREQCQTTELAAFQHYEQPKENNRKSLLVRFKAKTPTNLVPCRRVSSHSTLPRY
jgi:hypothetical protein